MGLVAELNTRSIASVTKAEYLNAAIYSRKFAGMSLIDPAWVNSPPMGELTLGLIEAGLTAWGNPEFEECALHLFNSWIGGGMLIRAQWFAKQLVDTAEGETREWLQCIANGDIWSHDLIRFNARKCPIRGHSNAFLYPLQLDKLIAAQLHQDATRAWIRRDVAGYCADSVRQMDDEKAIAQEWSGV